MVDLRGTQDLDAHGRVRPRRPARRRGDRHARPLPIAHVTVYVSHGCHLCEKMAAQLRPLRDELGFELEEIAIDGDPELEARYREWLPVLEIDGERAFVYYLDEAAFRRKLAARR
ncbi:MAG TPA: glutaredoxin family protein [Gaiellaceae bacterium]|nr:glutaredoxin family protein [Gaiellaceae bacterium]